ncbi:MAG TPA: hypothetical protein VMW38_13875, partial [Terriglobia bacterium]|nr:hypothetical protein [Terriglobia bacterium]
RAERGSHIDIFMLRGAPPRGMKGFHENPSFGSHDKLLLVCRGLLSTCEKPTRNSEHEFLVATHAVFIRRRELEKVMGHFHESAVLEG